MRTLSSTVMDFLLFVCVRWICNRGRDFVVVMIVVMCRRHLVHRRCRRRRRRRRPISYPASASIMILMHTNR